MREVKDNTHKLIYIILVVVIIGATVTGYKFEAIQLENIDLENFPALLGSLLAITLFIERSIEVLVNIVCSADAIDLENAINLKKDDIKNIEASGNHAIGQKMELRGLEKQIIEHKSETQKLSLKVSFCIGILVSAVGIRALGSMVVNIPQDQKSLFNLVDILITAGLLAGGSEGIHQLTSVYTNYMQNLAEAAKGKDSKNNQPSKHKEPKSE